MKKLRKGDPLFINGYPKNFGYSLGSDLIYNIEDARLPFLRLKEWDFYQIITPKYSFYAILGHVSYATSINCTLFEFETKKVIYVGKLVPFKKVMLDKSGDLDSTISYISKDYSMTFKKEGSYRYIDMVSNMNNKESDIHITLKETQNDSILVSTPFEKKKHFYLNQKINLMEASGEINIEGNKYTLDNKTSFALLDWGRGVLPFKHEWVWGSLSTKIDDVYFGFNLGSFGDNRNGTENIFYYGNKSYKLDEIKISFNKDNYMDEWVYESSCGSFMFKMTPFYDNYTTTRVLWVNNSCHQVFGVFKGYIIIDDKKIEIDNVIGFTEHAKNRW